MIFIKYRNLTFFDRSFLCFVGVGIIGVAIFYVESKFWFYVLSTFGLVIGYLGGLLFPSCRTQVKTFYERPFRLAQSQEKLRDKRRL
jgi:hypothetical protein